MIGEQGGAEEKRMTDGLLEIISVSRKLYKKYHIEYESTSIGGTMLKRVFEHTSQIALDDEKVKIWC